METNLNNKQKPEEILRKYMLIGKYRVKGWYIWLALCLVLGVAVGVLYFGNKKAQFEGGSAQVVTFTPSIFHASCENVHLGQEVFANPHTRMSTNELERRNMVERRIYDCMPKALRYIQQMKQESPAHMQRSIDRTIREFKKQLTLSIGLYYQDSFGRLLRSGKEILDSVQPIKDNSYPWEFPSTRALRRMQNGIVINPEWIINHPDRIMLALLDLKIDGHEVVPANIGSTPLAAGQTEHTNEMVGLISSKMRFPFPTLTEPMISLIDEVQKRHEEWAAGLRYNVDNGIRNTESVDNVAEEHHQLHHALERLSRDLNEQILLTMPQHNTRHEVCWVNEDGTPRMNSEITALIDEANDAHQKWTALVKVLDFSKAWMHGLRHSRAHAMLATCNINIPQVNVNVPSSQAPTPELSPAAKPPLPPITPDSQKPLPFLKNNRIEVIIQTAVYEIGSLEGSFRGVQQTGKKGSIHSNQYSISDGYVWWKINFDSGVDGWVIQDTIKNISVPSSPTPPPAPTQTPAPSPSPAPSPNQIPSLPPITPGSQTPLSLFQNDRIVMTAASAVYEIGSLRGSLRGVQQAGAAGSVHSSQYSSSDGYVWWKINFDSGPDGYVVQNNIRKVQSAATPPSPPPITTPPPTTTQPPTSPLPLYENDRIIVISLTAVRSVGALKGEYKGDQPVGATGRVKTSAPSISDGYTWWKIDFDSGVDGYVIQNNIEKIQ